MRYSVGLDIGVASVGYSVLALDSNDTPYRIEMLGSRIFDKAEHPKDGSSLAKPRREARSARRRLRRHRHRLERIRGLIVSVGLLTKEELGSLYDGVLDDIYELRTRALDKVVSEKELARIMIHLAQRRGYKSNRKSAAAEGEENGRLLTAVSENALICESKGYRTVGEMFYRDEKFAKYKRNKSDDYGATIDRKAVEDEVHLIFRSQREKGSVFASEALEESYLEILLSQRSFAEGPGSGPYSGNQVDRMRGKCTFEEGCPRAAKASYSFQLFNLCQRINHIRLIIKGEVTPLNDEQRQMIYDLAHQKADLNYTHIRQLLELPDDVDFAGVRCEDGKRTEAEKKTKLKDLESYHKIKKCIEKVSVDFNDLTHEQLDAIGEALSKNQSDDVITTELEKYNIADEIIEALLGLPNFAKFGHLSVKACCKIIPYLKQGMTYDKACQAAGYDFKAEKNEPKKYLPPISPDDSEITNPVVRRAVSQTIKVINAIIREMNESPVYINIELARELAYDFNERSKIKKEQDLNADNNEKLMTQLKEYYPNPTGQDLVKFKLWQEQDGRCLYSGEYIEIERLCEPGYVDVDHIVPYSICFDDRMANKVLVLARENRQKLNRLPLQYLQGKRRDDFILLVTQSHLKSAKKSRLLKEKITDESEWKQRNLQDTQYISSYMATYIRENLMFAPYLTDRKRHVMAVNGAITSYVRKRWGIKKVREEGDLHHAVDAVVVGCITQSMINRISKYSYYKETKEKGDWIVDEETGEVMSRFPLPWGHFRDELSIRLTEDTEKLRKQLYDVNYDSYADVDIDTVNAPFVSRMCNRKVTGAAHKETIRSGRVKESGKTLSKVALTNLKLNKDGEIANYYCPESDLLLYNALKQRLTAYDGDGKKAFEGIEFRKPKSDGTPGPVVKKVKIIEPSSSMVPVLEDTGVADNDTMVRCDVFYVENDGYYFVPIYVADTVRSDLPNLAPTRSKDKNTGKKLYKEMGTENFVFSLYKYDLIRIYSKNDIRLDVVNKKSSLASKISVDGDKGLFMYYDGFDVCRVTLSGIVHDNTYEFRSIGKTMQRIEKYEVDMLGKVTKIKKEKRTDFSQMKR